MTHEETTELLTVHALDVLDADERRALEAHLAGCVACRAEAVAWREVAASLAYAAPEVVPPRSEVLESILAQIRTEPRQPQFAPPAFTADSAAGPNGTQADQQLARSNVVSLDQRRREGANRRSYGKPLLFFGSIAASIAIAALAFTLFMLRAENRQLRSQLVSVDADLRRNQEELASLRADRELLAAPQTRTVALAGTEAAPQQAQARLTY
ncbi:MAG: zf-HC2 domain-containing protein, partial [Pyrinomonadaceae bacterium]